MIDPNVLNSTPATPHPAPAPGRRILALGDSITEACSLVEVGAYPAGIVATLSEGYIGWFLRHSGQSFSFDLSLNKGISGERTDQILARWSSDVAKNASSFDILLLMAGTNDCLQGTSVPSAFNNIKEIVQRTTQILGKVCVLIAAPPVTASLSVGTPNTRKNLMWLRTLLSEWAPTQPGVVFADPWRSLMDPASTAGNGLTELFMSDGVHPVAAGACRIGKVVADALAAILPPHSRTLPSPGDVYDPVNNPTGNLFANGALIGSGGVGMNPDFSAATINGALAGSWTLWHLGGSAAFNTCAASLEAQSPGFYAVPGNKQVLTFSIPGSSSNLENWAFYQAVNNVPVGAKVVAECELDVSGAINMSNLALHLGDSDNINFPNSAIDNYTRYIVGSPDRKPFDTLNYTGLVFRTPAYTIRAGNAVYVQLVMQFDGSGSGAGATIKVAAPTLRIVG
jgi:lysophospholipase L1-like esterase